MLKQEQKNFYKIIQGNCLEVMSSLGCHNVDLILTDPPYNIAEEGKTTFVNGKAFNNTEVWGNHFNDNRNEKDYSDLMNKLSIQYFLVLKRNGSIITFFDRGKPYLLEPFYRRFRFRNMIVFVNKNPSPALRKNNYRSAFEMCAWFSKEKYEINFLSQQEMKNVFMGCKGKAFRSRLIKNPLKMTSHPTEKMEWQIKPLIERHSKKGDTILDPFLGSGTTMKIAQDLERNCIGIELNPVFCKIAKDRCFSRSFLNRDVDFDFSIV